VDLYAVLAVGPDASTAEIHEAWKRLQKAVHPDVAGAYAATASSLLNEAKTVLGSKHDRAAFDLDRTEWLRRGGTDDEMFSVWNAEPLSAWSGPRGASTDGLKNDSTLHVDTSFAAFVDESRCIGCVQCATAAPNTFRIETRFGRARVVDQWADGPDAVADAVEICPVRCIHFVDPLLDLPILERVSGRLWKERGDGPGGISAKRGGGDASPFEVVDALRRRADLKTGLAPWPSRRRRASVPSNVGPKRYHDAGADVDTSSAAAAVAAAVRAANAAEAAAAETSDWRAGSFEEPSMDEDDDANEARGDTSLVFVQSPDVSASAFASAPGSPGPSGFSSRDAANNVVGFETGSNSETSKREVERLHALLRDAKSVSGVSPEMTRDGASDGADHPETDLFWKAPDASSRVRDGGDARFEASEDGDFAPSEWIRRVRRSRGRTLSAGNRNEREGSEEGSSIYGEKNSAQTNAEESAATKDKKTVQRAAATRRATLPRPLARLATAFLFAAIGVVISVAAPMDVEVVVSGTASGVSATGGWVGETTRTVVARGAPELGVFDESRWAQVACATAAWYAALGALAETADAVAKRRE
jgi:ferredoxin